MEGNTKGNTDVPSSHMAPSKPPLVLGSLCPFGDQNEKCMVKNGTVASATNIGDSSTSKFYQSQGSKPILSLNNDQDMDPKKLKRIISNRLAGQRSREKKAQYLANLEFQVKTYKAQIANLRQQVESYENQKLLIMSENEKLGRECETLRIKTLLTEVEIQKNMDEVNMLRKLHTMQLEQMQEMMFCNTSLTPMLNGQVSNYYPNTYQVSGNGAEETFGIPPTQSHM